MKKVRQISVQIDGATDKAVLPPQPGPFLLHAVYFEITPTAGPLFAQVSIVFGGVAQCVKIPVYLDESGGEEYHVCWIRGGAFYRDDDSAGAGAMEVIVLPLPSNMVLDSQFEVSLHVPDIDILQDQQSEVSFLVEDLQPEK